MTKKKSISKKVYSAPLSLYQAERSWFIHNNTVHSVPLCSVKVFRAFVKSLFIARWTDISATTLLQAYRLDLLSKWCILSSLKDYGVSFELYSSQEIAENALRLKSDTLAVSVPLSSAKPSVAHCSDTENALIAI